MPIEHLGPLEDDAVTSGGIEYLGPLEEDTSIGGELLKGVKAGWLGANKAVGSVTEYVGKLTGSEAIEGVGKTARDYWGDKLKKETPAVQNMTDIKNVDDFSKWAAWNVGQMGSQIAVTAPFMAAGSTAKAVPTGYQAIKALVTRAPEAAGQFGRFLGQWAKLKPMDIPIGLLEAGQIAEGQLEEIEQGKTKELNPIRGLAATFVATKLEELGAEGALNRLMQGAGIKKGNLLRRIGQNALATGAGEGTEEFFQSYAEQFGIDPSNIASYEQFKNAVNGAGAGFIGGFAMGGGTGAVSKQVDHVDKRRDALEIPDTKITQDSSSVDEAIRETVSDVFTEEAKGGMLNDLLGKEATIQPPTQEEGADRRPDTAMEAAETFFGPDVVQNEIALESLRKRGLYTPEDNMKSAEESAQVFEDEQRAKQSENIRREWEARKTSYQQPIGLLGTASPGTVDILDAQGNVVFSDPEAATDTKALPAPEKPTQALPVPETSYGDGFTFRGSEQERPILTTGGSPFKKESSALMAIRLKGLDPNLYGVTPYQGGFAITRNTGKTEFRISNEDAQDLAGFRDERIRAEEAISRRLDADKEMVPDVPPEETVSFPEIPMQVQPAEASLSADEIQPWQMTRAEIAQIEKVAGQIDSFSSSEVSIDGVTIPFERTKFGKDHKKAVQQALAENKPVPPEVLADYPDLTAENVLSPEARPAPDKRQAAIDRYIEHAKAYTSEEGARQQADKWAKAIDAKDYKTLRNIMNGINPKVNRLFTELTGLPAKTQKQADESLRSFDPEGWDKWQAERTEKREKEAAEREAAHRQRQADALLDKKVNYQGEVMATRDMYQRLVNEGLTRIESRKHGIADEYWLANPDTGMGVKIPKKILVDHIRGLIEQKNPTQKSNLPEASDADLDHLFGKVTPDSAHEAGRKAFSESKTRIVPETWTAEHKKAWYDGWDKANLEAQVESPEKKTGPTRVKISEDYKAAIQLIKDTIQRAFDSKKVIPVYGVTASGQREEIVGSTFHKNPVKSLKYGYSVGKLTERIGTVTKSVSVPLEQYEYIEIGGAEITEKPSQGGTVTIAHVGEKGATKGITIDLREPGKAAEEKIKEVEKALKPKPTPDLTKKSTAELVGDIFAIINDHIGQRGSVSLKEKALDDTLYEKIKPYIKVIADRAKAKALDAKTYLFGAVDSMPEGQAKDIYEAAADRYVEEGLKPEKQLLTYEEFSTRYREAFKRLDSVKPDAPISITLADEMAKLAEDYPEYMERFDRESEEKAYGKKAESSPSAKIADFVVDRLENHAGSFASPTLFEAANKAFGGTQAEGTYTSKDAYDALELGVNKYIEGRYKDSLSANTEQAKWYIDILKSILDRIPTQTKRTTEQDQFQQFSTPPPLAYAANWVANIKEGETYLEPSAGIGGIAVFGKIAGAKVVVNELSPRRAEVLKEMGFDQLFTENAEQLNNILPKDVQPSVIVMNPPFSATAGRISKTDTMNGARHIEQALKRLQDGGRLVAIVGEGMAADRPAFKVWWKEIQKKYNVLANIGVNGQEYKKYGTTFDNQILVIDKTGPTASPVLTGKADKIEDLIDLLEGVRNERTYTGKQSGTESAGEETATPSGRNPRPKPPVLSATGEMGDREQQVQNGIRTSGADQSDAVVETAKGHGPHRTGERGTGKAESSRTKSEAGSHGVGDSGRDRGQNGESDRVRQTEETIKVESKEAEKRASEELTDSVYESYSPSKLSIAGAKKHPGKLVESAAMSAVLPPDITYQPNIPISVVKDGKLSDAQLEAIVYAGQAHSQFLPGGEVRRGYFIGDGTGVGKGREISGIILDNWGNGRKKAIWISQNSPLVKDARRDAEGVTLGEDQIFDFGKIKAGKTITRNEGVAFLGYDILRAKSKDGSTRLQQLIDWFGKDYDGVIVFDEAHNMGNAIAVKGKRGTSQPSKKALAGIDLQAALPKARIVYVSATGATEVMNLAFADRLGLWGEGTPFANKVDFIEKVSAGGIAAMELVARDMKATGQYLARSLSYEDVKYEKLEHNLTPDQRFIYDELAGAWQMVLANVNEALKETGGAKNGNAKSSALSQFWGSHQRFFNQIITSMQTPAVIKAIEHDIESGRSAVIQLVNTNEAAQERAISRMEEGDELEDLDMTPREQLMEYVKNSFPVAQYQEVEDENGNTIMVVVKDSNGNPVENAEAVAMREELLTQLGSIRVPDGPLEMILNHFGVDKVAEITGRSRRVVEITDDSGTHRVIEKRSKAKTEVDADAYMNDKKHVLIFSNAGGTGRSYHADLNAQNQRLRRHYLLQAGWRADAAIQGFGRSHRSNQKQAPEYVLVTTDVIGQKRFISSIARRLDQLGALTKGQRETGSGGFFTARDNLESVYAQTALTRLVEDIYGHNVPGLDISEFSEQTGLKLVNEKDGSLNESKIPEVPTFLNRLLSMKLNYQQKIFDLFSERLDRNIRNAIESGTLDVGMETLRAKKVEKVQEQVVYADRSGAETKYVELKVTNNARLIDFDTATGLSAARGGFYKNIKSGKVWAASDIRVKSSLETGGINQFRDLTGPNNLKHKVKLEDIEDQKKYTKLTEDEARSLWDSEYGELPKEIVFSEHLITGTLLPIWDRLPEGHTRIMRVQTVEGERMIGRLIDQHNLQSTLRNLGASASSIKMSPKEIFDGVKFSGMTVELANGWKIARRKVSNEQRIELIGPDYRFQGELEKYGVFTERINWQTRTFIPTSQEGVSAIEHIISNRPVVNVITPATAKESTMTEDDAEVSYALTPIRTRGLSVKHIQPIADKVRSALKAAPEIHVIQHASECPPPVLRDMKNKGMIDENGNSDVRGFSWGDQVWLVSDNLESAKDAVFVLMHELTHEGLGRILSRNERSSRAIRSIRDDYNALMDAIYRTHYREVRAIAITTHKHLDLSSVAGARQAAEEWLCNQTYQTQSKWYDRLVAIFNDLCRAIGFDVKLKDAEVRTVLRDAFRTFAGEKKKPEAEEGFGEPATAPLMTTRYTRKSDTTLATDTDYSVNIPKDRAPQDDISTREETRGEKFIRQWQDHMKAFDTVRDALRNSGKVMSELTDVSRFETLARSKTANGISRFMSHTIDPLVRDIASSDWTMDDVQDYAMMRHIPEANEYLARLHNDPEATANGITTESAEAKLEEYEASPNFHELEALADRLNEISDDTLDILVESGVLSEESRSAMKQAYQHYVPLRGGEIPERSGKGMRVAGKLKRRAGHGERQEFILENVIKQRENAIRQANKNEAALSVLKFVMEAGDPDIGTVGQPQKHAVFRNRIAYGVETKNGVLIAAYPSEDEAKRFIAQTELIGQADVIETKEPAVVMQARPMLEDNEIAAYIHGYQIRVQLNHEGLAKAATNAGVEHLNTILSAGKSFNRYLTNIYTQYSPEFAARNIVRDFTAGLVNLTGDYGVQIMGKTMANYPRAIRELFKSRNDYLKSRIVKEYGEDGGQIGAAWLPSLEKVSSDLEKSYLEYLGTSKALNHAYQKAMSNGQSPERAYMTAMMKVGKASIKRIPFIGHFLKLVDKVNMLSENSFRLATYMTLRENGVGRAEAAEASKDVTLNFDRHGELTNQAGALYLFFNPAVQGVNRSVFALTRSRHKHQAQALAGMMIGAGFMLAMLGDDDDWDKINPGVKSRSLIVSIGGRKFATIPMSYEYGIYPAMGYAIADVIRGRKKPMEAALDVAVAVINAISPFGNPMDEKGNLTPYQLLPTTARLILAPSINKNTFGAPLMPQKYTEAKPDSATMWRSTAGTQYDRIARFLNEATGGTAYTKGAVDISPETLKFYVNSLTGGTGTFINKMTNMGMLAAQGAEPETREIPFVSSFIKDITPQEARSRFWERAQEAKSAAQAFNQAKNKGDREALLKIQQDFGSLLSLAKFADETAELAKAKRDAIEAIRLNENISLAQKRTEMHRIEMQEEAAYDNFLKVFELRNKGE